MDLKRKPKVTIAYGSLYLDQGESIEYAELQIAETIANCTKLVEYIYLVFDIVATPRQVRSGFAHQTGVEIINYVDEHYPTLAARMLGITDNDRLRPGRDKVLRGSKQVDNIHQFLMLGDEYDIYPQDS